MGKEWAGLLFPRGKNGPETDWGDIPACYTGLVYAFCGSMSRNCRFIEEKIMRLTIIYI